MFQDDGGVDMMRSCIMRDTTESYSDGVAHHHQPALAFTKQTTRHQQVLNQDPLIVVPAITIECRAVDC